MLVRPVRGARFSWKQREDITRMSRPPNSTEDEDEEEGAPRWRYSWACARVIEAPAALQPSLQAPRDRCEAMEATEAPPKMRPLSIDIDNANDRPEGEDEGEMEDLALSPAASSLDALDDTTGLMPLTMTDSASGERPLPSLHAPLTFRDVPFTVLYALHLLLVLAATSSVRSMGETAVFMSDRSAVVGGINTGSDAGSSGMEASDDQDDSFDPEEALSVEDVAIKLRSLCVINVLFALGWLLLFIFNSKMRFVQASCVFSITGMAILAVELFLLDNSDAQLLAIFVCALAGLEFVWSFKVRNGFDFVAVFFELVSEFLVMHPALGYVTSAMLVLYTIWVSWICTTIAYVAAQGGVSPWSLSMMVVYFHFYWTSNVFKNILTIVVSGATMLWYYRDDSSELSPPVREAMLAENGVAVDEESSGGSSFRFKMDRRVVLHYLRRALTTSFGSICVGSLLCPLAHLVWNILRWARRDESVLSRRFLSLRSEQADRFIRTYHKYSFSHIAGYGTPFYVAAHDTWALIEMHGVEAIVDDDLTSRILLLGGNGWASLMCALTVSAFATGTKHTVFFALASFTLCYTTLSIATQVIAAVIKTLFVCFAESPGRLSQLHPLIYHRFVRLSELKSFRDHRAPPPPAAEGKSVL